MKGGGSMATLQPNAQTKDYEKPFYDPEMFKALARFIRHRICCASIVCPSPSKQKY
jgi:hypothetical protein